MEIKTIRDLERALRKSWSKDTTYPRCKAEWVKGDPTYGQCAVTAMIVKDYFGGDICRIRVAGGGTHYFNKIDGKIVDLTREQFDLYKIPLKHEPHQIMTQSYDKLTADTKRRYNLLKSNITTYLKEH